MSEILDEMTMVTLEWERICSVDEISVDSPLLVEHDGSAYAVFQVSGSYFVIADQCSHGPGSLSEGYVEGHEIECPFHRGRFDIRTGCPTEAPCTVPIATWHVRVEDGGIWIQPSAPRTQNCGGH